MGTVMQRLAPGAFSKKELDEVHLWCSRMHANRQDGDDDDKPAIDAEDEALLLRLWQLKKGHLIGRRRRKIIHDHLVVDEAQDLSPVELMVLLNTVKAKAPVTLAGDTAQRLDADNDFQDWSYVLEKLGLKHVSVSPLQISYRSTAQIMRLARHVLGPLAPDEPINAPREGALPCVFSFDNAGEQITFLCDRLQDVMAVEPDANIAVLARSSYQADPVYNALFRADLPRLRRVADQDFTFAPGIDVTDITQAKGLEFDYVIIVDVDMETFPEDSTSRHLLHVGITRAAHMCWVFHCGAPSALLPPASAGLTLVGEA
jgi:DNA helicase-2/ATP-dependent DNA helicase PcrA